MAIRTRTLLTGSTIAMLMSAGAAYAQDATIHYQTPVMHAGQPVINGVPVVTPVPVDNTVPVAQQAGASEPVTAPGPDDANYSNAPAVQTSAADASVSFVSGGTGYYEKKWFDAHTGEFNLKVTYNDSTGHNLAGVTASLANNAGAQLFSTNTDGPFLLVKAKPGIYTLTSTYEGNTQSKKITIGKGVAHAGVVFTETNPDM